MKKIGLPIPDDSPHCNKPQQYRNNQQQEQFNKQQHCIKQQQQHCNQQQQQHNIATNNKNISTTNNIATTTFLQTTKSCHISTNENNLQHFNKQQQIATTATQRQHRYNNLDCKQLTFRICSSLAASCLASASLRRSSSGS